MNEDASQIEHEIQEHAGHLRRLALRLVVDEERADEVVQRTWLAALRSRPKTGRGLRAWLSRVARRCAWALTREELQRAAVEVESARRQNDDDGIPDPGEESARSEAVRLLLKTLGELEEPYGSVVLMRYFEGLEPTEIARRSGVPVATVRTRIHRGLGRLRENMRRRGADEHWALALLPALLLPAPTATLAAGAGAGSWIQGALFMSKKIGLALGIVAVVVAGLISWQAFHDDGESQLEETQKSSGAIASEARRNQDPKAREAETGAVEEESESTAQVPRRDAGEPAWNLLGRVVDGSRQGLARAEVAIELFRKGDITRRSVQTDESGRFHLNGLPLGEGALLRAGREGYAPVYRSVAAGREGERTLAEIVLPASSSLRGRVVDEKGRPVAKASVRPRPREHASYQRRSEGPRAPGQGQTYPEMRAVQTDEEGRFALVDLPAGDWDLAATTQERPTSFLRGQRLGEGETKADLEISLRLGVSIKGRLVNSSDQPVANAEVRARPGFLDREEAVRKTVRSDEEGLFVLEGLEEIPYTLGASAPGFISSSLFDVDGGRDGLTIRLEAAGRLFGRVLDRQTKEPLKDFEVRILGGLDFGSATERPIKVLTGKAAAKALDLDDAPGLWCALEIPHQRCEVQVRASGYAAFAEQRVVLNPGVPIEFPCELVPEAVLEGRVTDRDGRGVAGATVWAVLEPPTEENMGPGGTRIRIRRQIRSTEDSGGAALGLDTGAARSDEDGSYEIRGLGPGTWSVVAERSGWAASEETKIQLPEGGRKTVDLTLKAGGTIRGLVVDSEGQIRAGAQVSIEPATKDSASWDFQAQPFVVTDEEGRFEFQGVEAGKWIADIKKPAQRSSGMTFELEGQAPEGGVPVTVVEGEVAEVRIEMPPPTSVRGLVLETGRPAPGVRVKLFAADDGPSLNALESTTDAWGEFAFEDIKPGSYRMELRMPRSSAPVRSEVEVALGETAFLRLKLPTSQVSGRITAADGGDGLENMLVSLHRLIDGKPEPKTQAIMISVQVSSSSGAEATTTRLGDNQGRIRTDEDGKFLISHVPAGEYLLRVQGRGMLRESRPIEVKDAKRLEGQDFAMQPGRSLDLNLTGLGSQALALLSLKPLEDPNAETERKTSNGKPVVFRGLRPGRYEIQFRRISIGEGDHADAPEEFTREVTIPDDRDLKLEIDTLRP